MSEQEYVAVDQPRRAVGTALAVRADDALDRLGDVGEWLVYELVPAAPNGAEQLVRDWRHWQAARDKHAEIDAEKALAARQGMTPARLQSARDKADALAWWRMRLSWAVLAATALGLTVCSVLGHWAWEPWRWGGPALLVGQLAVGRYYRQRWALRTAWVWLPVFVALDITGWRWWPWWIAGGLLVAACVARGLMMTREEPARSGPAQQVGERVSFPKLWQTIADHLLLEHGVTARTEGGRPIVAEGQEVGVLYPVVADKTFVRAHLDALELLVGAPLGGVRWFADRSRAGAGVLHVRWTDVLDAPAPPPPPNPKGSGSVHHAKRIARGQLGAPLKLSRLRKHMIVLGGTGSGKTSLGWRLLDDVEENADEKPWGIDLRRKNLIAPFIKMFEGRVAYTPKAAEELLDRFQGEIDRRVARIAELLEDADEDGVPDENWIPTSEPGHEQLTLFIDELTSLTPHKKLREKLALIEETGRQAACVVVLLTPDLDSKKIVDSSIFDQPHVKMMMASSQYDVKEMFGVGASASGWGVAATWERPRDAGKLLISSDEHLHPEVYRADRLEVEDIVARRKWRKAEAARLAAERAEAAAGDAEVIDAEIVTDEDLAREAALRAALDLCSDREGLPVREVAPALGEDVDAALRTVVKPRSVYLRSKRGEDRCFPRNALVSALDGA